MILLVVFALGFFWAALSKVYYRVKYALRLSEVPRCDRSGGRLRSATVADLASIARLQKIEYPDDAVPEDVYRSWFKANPEGFFVLEVEGEVVGHITFLSFRKDAFAKYLQGHLLETQLDGSDLITPREKNELMTHLYVESVISTKRRSVMFFEAISRRMDAMVKICGPRDLSMLEHVYCMAATDEGKGLVSGFPFSIVSNASDRRDKHDMYRADFGEFMARFSELEIRFEVREIRDANRLALESQAAAS